MKFLVFFLSMFLSSSISRANEIETVKVFDGTIATCNSNEDTYRYRTGAYQISGEEVSIEDEKLVIDAGITFLKCSKIDDHFGFEEVSGFYTYEFPSILSTEEIRTIQVITDRIFVKSIYNRDYEKIGSLEIFKTSPLVDIRIEMDLEQALTSEQKAQLAAGEETQVEVDSFVTKNITYTDGIDEPYRDRLVYGSYRFLINLRQSSDGNFEINF